MCFPHILRSLFGATLVLVVLGCSRLEETETRKIRYQNAQRETIERSSSEEAFPLSAPIHTPRTTYPWEKALALPPITKEYFRCKGSLLHPPKSVGEEKEKKMDCGGLDQHGLPLVHGQEGVYPILLEQLNYLQKKTGKRVVITCGHRCPTHNTYADPSKEGAVSKHQIGAEVDFYVQGMEQAPEKVVELLQQYYLEMPQYRGKAEYQIFRRYEGSDTGVSTPPWMNKEIYIKLHAKEEGRDEDNQHSHPYITIQVRYDTQAQARVLYEWKKAHLEYVRKQ